MVTSLIKSSVACTLFLLFVLQLALFAQQPGITVEHDLKTFMSQKSVPGVAVALFYEGKSFLFNFGVSNEISRAPITENTIFEIASITKVFTSTALAIEVQKGRMSLNVPVSHYLPGVHLGRIPFQQITLLELATHTSSLPRVPPKIPNGYDFNKLVSYLEKWKPSQQIGTNYSYSNLGFGLIGYALSAVNGKSYEEVIRDNILIPLNMSSTEIIVPSNLMSRYAQGYSPQGNLAKMFPLNAWAAGGALRSTSRDMLNFLMANLGVKGPENIIQAMQFAQQGLVKVNDRLTMGLGWQRVNDEGLLLVDKNGGVEGFSSYIGMLPSKKMGIVILANKGKTQITSLGRKILVQLGKFG